MRTEPFAAGDVAPDAFLGGRATVLQPHAGYRAGIDPVVLAASVPARSGQAVLDLGCGAGPALCCLGMRVPGLRLAGIEIQPAYADLARRNLVQNGLDGTIWDGDVAHPPREMRAECFDFVMLNPPFFESGRRTAAPDSGREVALAGHTPLSDWIACAARRLKPYGYAHVIQRAERLPDLIAATVQVLGSLELWPLAPREGHAPRLILMRARKEGRAPFRFHAPLILHDGRRHEADQESYSAPVLAATRDGAALPFPA